MGMFSHEAIVITTDTPQALLIARFCFDVMLPVVSDKDNETGLVTLLVPPSGNRSGRDTAQYQRKLRKQLLEFLISENHWHCSWVHVRYGDMGNYVVTDPDDVED